MTNAVDDFRLLRRYATEGAESAFRELVDRYLGMVLGCAERATGNRETAQEVAQSVFTVLARKAGTIREGVPLGAWLHRATVYEASRSRHRELRRREKMKAFANHMKTDGETTATSETWKEVLPLIDSAVNRLSRSDRGVVLQRFFEGRSYRDIGSRLGKSEDAIRKQVQRALAKLARVLGQRGVAVTGTVLASLMGSELSKAAPAAEMVGAVSTEAVAMAVPVAAVGIPKSVLIAVILAAVPLTVQWKVNAAYASEVAELNEEPGTAGGDAATPRSRSGPGDGTTGSAPLRTGVDLRVLRQALEELEKTPDEMRSLFAVLTLLHQLEHDQLAEAFRMVEELSGMKLFVHDALFARWARFDPTEAIAQAQEIRWSSGRLHALQGIFDYWITEDTDGALAAMGELSLGFHHRGMLRDDAIYALVAADPVGAVERLDQDLDAGERAKLLEALSWGWPKIDPAEALKWAATLSDPVERQKTLPIVLGEVAKNDPESALETAMSLEDRLMREESLDMLFRRWSMKSVEEAMRVFTEVLPPEMRSAKAIDHLCWSCAGQPVDRVLGWSAQIPDANVRHKYLSMVASSRSGDIEGSLELLAKVPECKWREHAVANIVGAWLPENEEAALRWLEELPPSHSRDAGVANASWELADEQPRKATEWAATIADPERRPKILKKAIVAWIKEDREEAATWIGESILLSDQEREELAP